ncbi:MFS transporter [Actinocrispum wychmicini]|uniref:Putative MFS family arabinose efflux permease n=1 Tax=Actinocrispum wychmicini TaxID=1213861 RepID=A0A4R2JIB3_9PSEU|nr:MFS transporter [Actinocrispum wychmicini]TCO58142.1 putative MFS family arabinose efflux permease [Actinocrispum wychmicini]
MLRSGSDDHSGDSNRGDRSNRKKGRKWTAKQPQQFSRGNPGNPPPQPPPPQQPPPPYPRTRQYQPPPPPPQQQHYEPQYQQPAGPPPIPEEYRQTTPVRREPPPPPSSRYGPDGYPVAGTGQTGPYEYYESEPEAPKQPEAQHGFEAAPSRPTGGLPQAPKKLTVTRVAALRSKQLTQQAVHAFKRAANADGADKSGLTALTYATMLNYASDAAMAVALANTLFFAAASADSSKGKIALYLLITVAPFALVAPVIGPALDRIQRGRRLAMCVASAGQALMCVLMATQFTTWWLYPAALGKMVLSKSFTVLKAAVTPRVLPPDITLSKTNARLTVFGLFAGMVFGGIAAGMLKLFDSSGALWFTAIICVVGAVQAMKIPAWVEVTEGEVPATLSATAVKPKRQPMGQHVVVSLWANGTVKVLTGFLMMFSAFAVRAETEGKPIQQLLLLGLIAAAAGVGSFGGNAIGTRLHVHKPEQMVIGCVIASLCATVLATIMPGIGTMAVVGLIAATAAALAKNSLDAVIQDDLPEESRASAFGRSETVLQLGWVFGGALGVLLPATFWVGFLVVSLLLALGLLQTIMANRGTSLLNMVRRQGGVAPRPGQP